MTIAPRILVAEDDALNQQVIVDMLGLILPDARIDVVADGAQALDALGREPYDLVLSDVDMPVMDGMELVARIQADPGLSIPVIAVTAFAVVGDRERLLMLGFQDYVSKPIDFEVFRNVLARHVRIEAPS